MSKVNSNNPLALKMVPKLRAKKIQSFAALLVNWQRTHGRHDLPWQKILDPYRVWVSEIMLQQTQVATVISYFDRFMKRFPTVKSLANADQDEVLGLWSGLGYYSRARNLHRCAQDVVKLHGGLFPKDYQTLQSLPGIGPSTAAAVASICFSERVPILDGNVKRVLTRLAGYGEDLSRSPNLQELWGVALGLLPASGKDMPIYTQGIMDLGATVCTPKNPKCEICPAKSICTALAEGDPLKYPVKTRKIKRTTQSLWMVCLINNKRQIWLEKRPTKGIWASLYSVPVFTNEVALKEFAEVIKAKKMDFKTPITHALTHKELILHWVQTEQFSVQKLLDLSRESEHSNGAWFSQTKWSALGLSAPVRKFLLDALA
jgi:A/G-specific adenine glycosylase